MKTVLITGAGSGIGRATALRLSNDGFEVLLTGRRKEKLEETAQLLDGPCAILPCDLQKAGDISSLCQMIISNTELYEGQLTGLINNAGVYLPAPLLEADDADWEKMFYTNLLGPVRLARGLHSLLKTNSPSFIINVSSSAALRPVVGIAGYASLKAALSFVTQTMALEWASDKIRVNSLSPGIVDTPIHSFHGDETVDREPIQKLQPLGRIGTVDEIAEAVSYLSSESCLWMTGSDLVIDGGIHLQ